MRGGRRSASLGQTLVEFALSASALLVFLFGVVIMARGIYAYDTVAYAAQQGARWAMVRGNGCTVADCPATSSEISAFVQTKANGIANEISVTPTYSTGNGCTSSGDQGRGCVVSVTVSYPFRFSYPLAMSVTLSNTATMTMTQ